MEYSVGIMQGRLTPSRGRGIQFFPFDNWKEEFNTAKEIGIDEIEFIFDFENYTNNPLWIGKGEEVGKVVKETGVQVRSVCFDYFMRRAFFKFEGSKRLDILEENRKIISRVIRNMDYQGIRLIEIPLVDDSSLKTDEEKRLFVDFILKVISDIPESIRLGFETDLPPQEFKEFLATFDKNKVGANYDTGNSSGIGYNPIEELKWYGDRIFNIHIKDRKKGGATMSLGTGSADFDSFFETLAKINYSGSFILQAARGDDGTEERNIVSQLAFVKEYIRKYL